MCPCARSQKTGRSMRHDTPRQWRRHGRRRTMANMATHSQRPKRTAEAATRPSLRFFYSSELRAQTLDVLEAIAQSEDPLAHRSALADVVIALTYSGLDYFFMQPLLRAKMGFVAQRSANIGLATLEKAMAAVCRSIIGHMNEAQLRSVGDSLKSMME